MESLLLGKALGRGGFGTVYRGELDGEIVATKRLESTEMGVLSPIELFIMKNLIHPNINFAKSIIVDKHAAYCISDVARGDTGSLRGRWSHSEIKSIFFGALGGLVYMHSLGLVHCDIKPTNILYYKNKVKLNDFSVTCFHDVNMGQWIGTKIYFPPEVFKKNGFSYSRDIWSLGCTVYELVTGEKIINDEENLNVLQSSTGTRQLIEKKLEKIPNGPLRYLLSRMLCWRPEKRYTAKDLYGDSFFHDQRKEIIRRRGTQFKSTSSKFERQRQVLQEYFGSELTRKIISVLKHLHGNVKRKTSSTSWACMILAVKVVCSHVPKEFGQVLKQQLDLRSVIQEEVSILRSSHCGLLRFEE